MSTFREHVTRPLTLKYVFALSLLAALAIVNFVILRVAILESQRMHAIVHHSSRQRVLLLQTAMLADRLIFSLDDAERDDVRRELILAIEPLERTHLDLMLPAGPRAATPPSVRAVYDHAPSLLDSEMRNYVLHLRSIAAASDADLNSANVHFKYVRNPETIDKIVAGLDAVVAAYEHASAATTAKLRLLAAWSITSTLVLLLFDGWFVFRPMVQRVREDMGALNELNATLERRVAERTAEAERRADLLTRSEAALRDSEDLYRSLVEHLPMCVMRKDAQGRFTFANDRFCLLVGEPIAAILGRTDADFYPPAMAQKYLDDDRRVMQRDCVFQDVEQHQTPDGRRIHVEVLKSPLRDANGTIIGTQTVFWDVTDRQEAEQRAIQAERLAAIGQMVAGVAHESRNALQQIQACAQLLDWQLAGDSDKQELVADLQRAQDRLRRLFDELRGFSSPPRLELRPCNVHAILTGAWAAIESQRAKRDADLREVHCDLPPVAADPFQLEQIFRNILENALAACDDPVKIAVEYHEITRGDGDALEIVIRDNGPGLTAEQQQRIFEPFFTTKTRGTGLGMAIVKQIVDAHGGDIAARNARAGAEFAITLPVGSQGLAAALVGKASMGEPHV